MIKFLEEPNWGRISSSPYLTEDFIIKYIEKPWSWEDLVGNPILTPEIVLTFWDLIREHWDWNYLTISPHVTVEMVLYDFDFMEMEWDECQLHRNPNVTPEIIEKYEFDIDWNWEYMYENPNLTIKFIEDNIEKICHYRLIGAMIHLKLEGFDLEFVKKYAKYFIWIPYYIDLAAKYFGMEPDDFWELT